MMDVEIVAGLCPKATIDVYFATFDQNGWVSLLNKVMADRPVTLSVSYSLAEDDSDWAPNALKEINKRLIAASAMGITICVSSGDDGTDMEQFDGAAHVGFPAASPAVLAVGGTMLVDDGSAGDEVVWWEAPGERFDPQGNPTNGGSTGGGVSTKFERPSWQDVQVQSLNTGSIDGRVVPDVAALAGDPLYFLIFLDKDAPNGGTSASTPTWASLIARINAQLPAAKQQRFLTPLLYQAGASGRAPGQDAFVDITQGDNTTKPEPDAGYDAGPGFDAVTGWGVPDGVKLLNAL
jgi:kumamolisin